MGLIRGSSAETEILANTKPVYLLDVNLVVVVCFVCYYTEYLVNDS